MASRRFAVVAGCHYKVCLILLLLYKHFFFLFPREAASTLYALQYHLYAYTTRTDDVQTTWPIMPIQPTEMKRIYIKYEEKKNETPAGY